MSVLQYSDSINSQDLQIWNNAAFDNGESEDSTVVQVSLSSTSHLFVNGSKSFESDTSKENLVPVMEKSPVSIKNSMPFTPLHPNRTASLQGKPLKVVGFKKGALEPSSNVKNLKKEDGGVSEERKIDAEIKEIENEISRLSRKLEALRVEKAEQAAQRQGRLFPAKIVAKNINQAPLSHRGFSLCPSEILAGSKSRQFGKPQLTPIPSTQSRRKSCFWKIQEIDELKVTKERRMSMTVSPKQRKAIPKIQPATTTIVSKRPSKKEDGVMSLIQPKKLFNDGEKSAPTKKPVKLGRVVASRYNQVSMSEIRKRSWPEDGKEEGKRADKRRASDETGRTPGTEGRMKKRWEIPVDVPKIKTVWCVDDSPGDSGPAKRVADLTGRRNYFGDEDKVGLPICQALSFVDEDGEEDGDGV